MKEFVKSITSPYEKELIEIRRYLHRHPELSFQETDTADYIRPADGRDLRNQHGRCHKR